MRALPLPGQVVHDFLDVVAAVRRRFRGQPDGGDFGMRVGDPGNAQIVDRLNILACDGFCHQDALREPDVGKLERGDQIADGVDRGDRCAAPFIDFDVPAVRLDPC